MATKQMMFEHSALQEMKQGVEQLAKAVKVTMGPTGRNVVMQKSFGGPVVTKDGVTVAKEITLPESFENMGAKMVQEVAKKTNDIAGDGTTTATVLAEAIFTQGIKVVSSGANPVHVQRGVTKAAQAASDALDAIRAAKSLWRPSHRPWSPQARRTISASRRCDPSGPLSPSRPLPVALRPASFPAGRCVQTSSAWLPSIHLLLLWLWGRITCRKRFSQQCPALRSHARSGVRSP